MAILKVKQIRETTQDGLSKKLSELRLELLKEQGNVKMGRPIKNPGKIRVLKKTIARVATIQQERRLKEVKK